MRCAMDEKEFAVKMAVIIGFLMVAAVIMHFWR